MSVVYSENVILKIYLSFEFLTYFYNIIISFYYYILQVYYKDFYVEDFDKIVDIYFYYCFLFNKSVMVKYYRNT